MTIAEQLKKKRKKLDLSQEFVADKVGISRRTLAYYESGERIPNAENLILLCNFYSLDINKLISQDINIAENNNSNDNDNNSNEIIAKVDEYLNLEKAKKESFNKGMFYFALILSIVITIIVLALAILRFVLMSKYDFSFSEATAKMWTSLFETLIKFVNDPTVKFLPVLSIIIISIILICWIIYFLIKFIKKLRNKWTNIHSLERLYTHYFIYNLVYYC